MIAPDLFFRVVERSELSIGFTTSDTRRGGDIINRLGDLVSDNIALLVAKFCNFVVLLLEYYFEFI